MKRLERGYVDLREGPVARRRTAVRRERLGGFARLQSVARLEAGPALLVRRDEIDVQMQRVDLPDAVLPHVSVLVDAVAPLGMLLVLAEHPMVAPARCGTSAVLGDEDRGL